MRGTVLTFALTLPSAEKAIASFEIRARNWNAAVGSGFLGGARKEATQNGLVTDLRRLCAASVAVSSRGTKNSDQHDAVQDRRDNPVCSTPELMIIAAVQCPLCKTIAQRGLL